MMKSDEYCKLFYASHYIPIAYYDSRSNCFSVGFSREEDPYLNIKNEFKMSAVPCVYDSGDSGCYGYVSCSDGYYIIGPVYSTAISDAAARAFIRIHSLTKTDIDEALQFLNGIPKITYNQFTNLLAFLHYSLNGELINVCDIFNFESAGNEHNIAKKQIESAYLEREENIYHGTYFFERRMLDTIEKGDLQAVENFFLSALDNENLREGQLADTPIRQAKNLLIGTATMVGKEAAIPAGVDIEEVYQLIDAYIQECEKLQTIEAIKSLQYNMIIDFTKRIAKNKLPDNISSDVRRCIQFIHRNLNITLTVNDIANHIGKSRAYICDRFKREMDMGIAKYVTIAKLREAQSLLKYTDKSLSEISTYLSFSSQSYFQNTFKKYYGITPLEYRNASGTELCVKSKLKK